MRPPYGRAVSVLVKPGRRETESPAPILPKDPPASPIALWRLWRWLDLRRDLILGPLAGAVVLGFLVRPGDPLRVVLLALCLLAAGASLARRVAPQAALLPLMRHIYPLLGPAIGLAGLVLIALLTGDPHAGPLDLLAALLAGSFVAQPWGGLFGSAAPGSQRVAFIGSPAAAARLARALDAVGSSQYVPVGRVAGPDEPLALAAPAAEAPEVLGRLGRLASLVVEHDIDLLLMTGEPPRHGGLRGGGASPACTSRSACVELSGFYEEAFGHVAVAEINAAWFQWIVHPKYRGAGAAAVERALDLVVAGAGRHRQRCRCCGDPRADHQPRRRARRCSRRSGSARAAGRSRSTSCARCATAPSTEWATARRRARDTRIGRFLRRTHLDELPQVLNVLRGEMSVVGPRPEQPAFVDRLEQVVPFYQRRHLMKPGLTGWAQVRCGYAGSDIGSAWKVCHDLYYLKHRSIALRTS